MAIALHDDAAAPACGCYRCAQWASGPQRWGQRDGRDDSGPDERAEVSVIRVHPALIFRVSPGYHLELVGVGPVALCRRTWARAAKPSG